MEAPNADLTWILGSRENAFFQESKLLLLFHQKYISGNALHWVARVEAQAEI